MHTCVEVPKGTPLGEVVPRLHAEDIASAAALFVRLLKNANVDTSKVGVLFASATATQQCSSPHRHDRRLRKRDPSVDGDQSDTIGLSFTFNLMGNAVDVAAATKAAKGLTYGRTNAVVLRSPVMLNHGGGHLIPAGRTSHCHCH